MDTLKFTPSEQKILAVLADGMPHHKSELRAAFDPKYPDSVEVSLISMHISNIRKKLEPVGQTIVCRSIDGKRMAYQHVRLLHSPYDGRT